MVESLHQNPRVNVSVHMRLWDILNSFLECDQYPFVTLKKAPVCAHSVHVDDHLTTELINSDSSDLNTMANLKKKKDFKFLYIFNHFSSKKTE